MKLEGRVAIVTGAAQGIGRAIAEILAEEGLRVAIWDINPDTAAEVAKSITNAGGQVVGRVQRLDWNARDRRGLDAVVTPGGAGAELLLPDLLGVFGANLHA